MIYPSSSGARGPAGRCRQKSQPVVQWKQRNVQEGLVVVDEHQLSRLIKRDPIEKYYELDAEPFATGMFSNVRRCRSRDTGQHFAAKFSSRARYGEDCSAEIHHEIALLSLCSPSQRIIRLHDVFETDLEIIIVLEYAPGGDLQTIIDDNLVPFESDVVKFVRQLVEGLAYLHKRKIAHLDIKPQNLVMMADFPDCDVKLCDFEISRVILEGTEIREILGTPDYVAPEILHYEPITLAADMWSLGVTTYVLLTGFSPFGGETDQETFCNISRAQLDFPEELFEDISEDARDFIRQLLVRDPSARPTAKECLHHKWFTNHGKSSSRVANRSESFKESSSAENNAINRQKNLRKYLSKSREALFERVVQQQQNQRNSSLRKTTLLNQYHKTRLCESQVSLVSKSRERLLMADNQLMMSPSFSRSREKLYGLRSLSKSHEVLDLCKGIGGVVTATPGILRTLTRATTADLSMLPFWRQQKLMAHHGSSTASIPSSLSSETDSSQLTCTEDGASWKPMFVPPHTESLHANVTQKTDTVQENLPSSDTDLNVCATSNKGKLEIENVPSQIPSLNKSIDYSNGIIEKCNTSTEPNATSQDIPSFESYTEQHEGHKIKTNIEILKNHSSPNTTSPRRVLTTENSLHSSQNSLEETETETIKSINIHTTEECTNEASPPNLQNLVQEQSSGENTKHLSEEESDDEEPRYTVAQLVSAFNRHQEVVTKTSIDVTMTTNEKSFDHSHFPTGPNALRLFIPDIDITSDESPRSKCKQGKTCTATPVVGSQLESLQQKSSETSSNDCFPEGGKEETDVKGSLSSSVQTVLRNVKCSESHVTGVENIDSTNNNDAKMSVCQLVIESSDCSTQETEGKGSKDKTLDVTSDLYLSVKMVPQYIRSGSLSSEASLTPGTPSETAMSWEELSPLLASKQQQKTKPSISASETSGSSPSWGRVCTGSYTRAMEKFSGKACNESEKKSNRMSLTLPPSPKLTSNEKTRRKSSPTIKPFN